MTSQPAEETLRHVYHQLLATSIPGLIMSLETAELVKVSAPASMASPASRQLAEAQVPSASQYRQQAADLIPRQSSTIALLDRELARPDDQGDQSIERTILMPCLNEAETVETCVRTAFTFLHEHGVRGEVIVADNGGTAGSQRLAIAVGASGASIPGQGYGNALLGGINVTRADT